jgi:phosphohistidine phosphatase
MYLYLVQHGEAKPEQEDPARPLTEKGRADVGRVALLVTAAGKLKITAIHHSPKTRAAETALILGEYIAPPVDIHASDGLLPLDDPLLWISRLMEINADCMLVGHLPHLAKLASRLVSGRTDRNIIEFKMGGMVCLHRSDEGIFSIAWMIVPEMLP